MAKADVKMPDEFLSRISRLGAQTDSIAEKMLQAGGEVLPSANSTTSPMLKPSTMRTPTADSGAVR